MFYLDSVTETRKYCPVLVFNKGFPTNFRKSTPCKFQNPFVHDAFGKFKPSNYLWVIYLMRFIPSKFVAMKSPNLWVKKMSYVAPSWMPVARFIGIPLLQKNVHPGRWTCNLRIHPWKRKIIFRTIIFRFYVNLRGCSNDISHDFILGGCRTQGICLGNVSHTNPRLLHRTARLTNDFLSFPAFAPCGPNGTDGHRTTAATTREPKKIKRCQQLSSEQKQRYPRHPI